MSNYLARKPRPRLADASFAGHKPADILPVYGFPTQHDGSGITLGIAEWGSGYAQSDMDLFCAATGLPPCTPIFRSVDGTPNDGGTSGGDTEATLDVEWGHAAAPGARLVVYECNPGVTMADFGDAVHRLFAFVLADPDRPQVLSVSYGDAEADWPATTLQQWEDDIAALKAVGCFVFVASGDQGSYGTHTPGEAPIQRADGPATCPSAIAVGGTKIPSLSPLVEQVWNESGWGGTGGGYSSVFARPAYQDGVSQHPMRGEPDLAALADPFTGYFVVFEGAAQVIGGTSAACPLVAGLFARLLQARKQAGLPPLTDLHALIYGNPHAFRDIVGGDNAQEGAPGYPCTVGWDACTGMGAPKGDVLLSLIAPQSASAPVSSAAQQLIIVNGKSIGEGRMIVPGEVWAPVRMLAEGLGAKVQHATTASGQGEVLITLDAAPRATMWQRVFGGR